MPNLKRCIHMERIPGPLALIYEKATRFVLESYYRPVAEEVAAAIQTGTLLDLGTGPGYLPIEIARRAPAVRIIGIDLGRRIIQLARDNARKTGLTDQITFETADAARLRFRDDTFDMVLSTGMLHMLKDPVKVLRECRRVLKPGAAAWIYDPARVSSSIDKEQWKQLLSGYEKWILRCFRWYAWIDPPQTFIREQIEQIVLQSGFKASVIEQNGEEFKIKLRK